MTHRCDQACQARTGVNRGNLLDQHPSNRLASPNGGLRLTIRGQPRSSYLYGLRWLSVNTAHYAEPVSNRSTEPQRRGSHHITRPTTTNKQPPRDLYIVRLVFFPLFFIFIYLFILPLFLFMFVNPEEAPVGRRARYFNFFLHLSFIWELSSPFLAHNAINKLGTNHEFQKKKPHNPVRRTLFSSANWW